LFPPDQPRQEIEITLPDGSVRKGTSWETSPMDVANQIAKSLAEKVIIAKVSLEVSLRLFSRDPS
jgi:threonyl-tRNA synthetase